jgi:hypothetical protein
VTRLWAERLRIRVPAGTIDFFLAQIVQTGPDDHSVSVPVGHYRRSFSQEKCPGSGADHSYATKQNLGMRGGKTLRLICAVIAWKAETLIP